jgi:hypothetical protein
MQPSDVDEGFQSRQDRLNALTPRLQTQLSHVVGEAALDLWLYGESWPDLVDRCLEAISEEEPNGPVEVRRFED